MEPNNTTPDTSNHYPQNHISLLVRSEAERVILQHLSLCPFAQLKIEERLRNVESRFAALIGFMFGSGLLGGAAGAAIIKAFSN